MTSTSFANLFKTFSFSSLPACAPKIMLNFFFETAWDIFNWIYSVERWISTEWKSEIFCWAKEKQPVKQPKLSPLMRIKKNYEEKRDTSVRWSALSPVHTIDTITFVDFYAGVYAMTRRFPGLFLWEKKEPKKKRIAEHIRTHEIGSLC